MKMNSDCSISRNSCNQSALFFLLPRCLLGRLFLLGVLVAIECVACFPNVNRLFGHQRFPHIAFVSYAMFLGLGYSKFKSQRENLPFGRICFAGHLICIGAVFCSTLVRLQHGSGWLLPDAVAYARSAPGYAWSAIYLLGTFLLALACVPFRTWGRTIRATSPLWLYSLLAGVAAWILLVPFMAFFFNPYVSGPSSRLQIVTFNSVLTVMRYILPNLVADAASVTLGTPGYLITIAGGCSGVEGLGLILAFSAVWLWYLRKETRFPQALLLIPGALGCIWLMNVLRLCTLILVGSLGSPEVADIGLHSQFGWISFTIIALTFSMLTQRLSWVRKAPNAACGAAVSSSKGGAESVADASVELAEDRGESPAIRAYLVPFLAILAASFVSKAASGYFEWLYPLRFVAAAIAIWSFRRELKKLDWRFGWVGPAIGAAIFLVWIAPAWIATAWAVPAWMALFAGAGQQHAASPLGPALAALSPAARWVWIGFRVAAAVVTVPIAEELAFRGYLARRFISREFDGVPFTGLTALSIVLSSAAFGLMHGQHWVVGTLAGLAFAGALRWRGRMGDAVVAHAVSNLLLAAWVLGTGDWGQW
jgi:exosortase E/protease (VPEID-CTERM system)